MSATETKAKPVSTGENALSKAVVIGASAGGVDALFSVLGQLPRGYDLPVFVVIHLPPDNTTMLPDLLSQRCRVPVKEAEDKESIAAGTVYLAPPNYHLLVERTGFVSLSTEEPVHFSRPAIDVLFESASDAYGEGLVGVILTGASADGAAGLACVVKKGGRGLVQDPKTAHVSVMPAAAASACPEARILSLNAIGAELAQLGRPRTT